MARQGIALCNKINERLLTRHMGDKCFAQPKLNGLRGWTDWTEPPTDWLEIETPSPFLVSSGGNKIQFFKHIEEELKRIGLIRNWDGEIYKHLMCMEDIHSIARRTVNKKEGLLDYWIFDVKMPVPQHLRIDQTQLLSNRIDKLGLKHIKVVPTYAILTADWKQWRARFVEEGYEGIILRKWDGPYVERKSNYLLKSKATIKKQYKITGVLQGEGWCYDRAGSIVVSSKETGEFAVGSGRILTASGRLDIWKKRNLIIGEYLTVKHEEQVTQTNTGKPRGCNAWAIEGVAIDF